MKNRKPKKLHILKAFAGCKTSYFILISNANGWHWVHMTNGDYFSRNHRTKYEALWGAKNQGTILKIKIKHLFPVGS
jgi:hypothetical protein